MIWIVFICWVTTKITWKMDKTLPERILRKCVCSFSFMTCEITHCQNSWCHLQTPAEGWTQPSASGARSSPGCGKTDAALLQQLHLQKVNIKCTSFNVIFRKYFACEERKHTQHWALTLNSVSWTQEVKKCLCYVFLFPCGCRPKPMSWP